MATNNDTLQILTPEQLLKHWQGHRRLTRRVIDAFPEDKLFSYSLGSMRPFSEMAMEFIKMAEPIVQGVATGEWVNSKLETPKTKAELLALWDKATGEIDRIWATIPRQRFVEVDTAFGQWKSEGINTVLYAVENEIHHRGQGFVYLRSLGIEPPAFYDRS